MHPGNVDGPLTTSLYDMDIVFDPPGSAMFQEVYLYEELMEADLHAIVRQWREAQPKQQIRSGQPLSDAHFQSFMYQTLCGLKVGANATMHSVTR